MLRSTVLALTTILALAVGAPAASATVFSGGGTDPAGDGPSAGQDIVGVDAAYDSAGSVTASMTLAGAPDPMFFYLQVGSLSGGTCGPPFVALGGNTDSTTGVWGLSGDSSSDFAAATVTTVGSKMTITASGARLANGAPNCLTGSLAPKATAGNPSPAKVDEVDAPVALSAPPAPPVVPAPPPAPTPPAPAPAPPATPQQTVKAAAPKKVAKLAVTISGVPRTVRRNHWMTLKVRLADTGTAAASALKLKVGTARGFSATPRTIKVKSLKAGKSITKRVKVRLTSKARKTTSVTFKASGAKKLSASSRLAITIGTAKKVTKKKPSAPTAPPTPKSPLAGTYWWYTINHADFAWDNHGVFFIDDQWAYRGIPKGGPPTCTAVTAGTDAKGEETDGCINYTYDAATGVVTLGTAGGSFKDGHLQLTDEGDVHDYDKLVIPAAGARYDVDLVHRSFQGLCGPYSFCTTSLATLRLQSDGQFVLGSSTTSTLDTPISFTGAGSYPPDQHGTYDVQAGGRIHLAFADGTVKDETFALQTDKAGNPDPVTEGVMLDEDNFYKETD